MPRSRATKVATMGTQKHSVKHTAQRATKRSIDANPFSDFITPLSARAASRRPPPPPPSLAEVKAREEYESEDAMTAALENLEYGAEEMLIWLSRMADIPEQSEDKRAWQKNIADRTVKSILALRRAVARGQIWTAVQHAFFAGMFSGHSEASPYLYHAERKLRREAPDVARGVKVIESARKGGRKGGRPKEGPSTETLCSEVTALHGKNCMRSWSWACQEVGTRNNLNRSTVMRRTKDVQWRMP